MLFMARIKDTLMQTPVAQRGGHLHEASPSTLVIAKTMGQAECSTSGSISMDPTSQVSCSVWEFLLNMLDGHGFPCILKDSLI